MASEDDGAAALRALIEAEMACDREDGSDPAKLRYFEQRVAGARRRYEDTLARRRERSARGK